LEEVVSIKHNSVKALKLSTMITWPVKKRE